MQNNFVDEMKYELNNEKVLKKITNFLNKIQKKSDFILKKIPYIRYPISIDLITNKNILTR